MSLLSALHTGRTGLTVNQAALEVTGNNLANSATKGYSRQSAVTAAGRAVEVQPGAHLGTGVRLEQIVRQVDEALLNRLRSATSDRGAAEARDQLLTQIEAIQAELTDAGLSSKLTNFLRSWSELANNPTDSGLRSLVIAEGGAFADFLNTTHADLGALRGQLDDGLAAAVTAADGLLDRIASLNRDIVTSEKGHGGANDLRDERDRLLADLAELLDISTHQQPNGSLDVFVGSTPIVLGGESRGLSLERKTVGDELHIALRVDADGGQLKPSGGRIGQLIASREEDVHGAMRALDEFAHHFMGALNDIHASGQGERGFAELTGASRVADPDASLGDGDNGLDYAISNGSFRLHVKDNGSGTNSVVQVPVKIGNGGGADTTLADLAAAIDAVGNVNASVTADGRLRIEAASPDHEFSFSGDTSGALAALGLNTFFTGNGAGDIAVNGVLDASPAVLAAGQGHVAGDNRNALAIARVADAANDELGGQSLRDFWRRHVEQYAIRTDRARGQAESAGLIAESLEAQRQSVSGVNLDEEAINMLAFQRAFQGSARFITVVDELMETMLGLVR